MLMPSDPLISVVIPAYNGQLFIGEAIASVLRQTYPKFEIVVADDASSDGTRSIVRQFQDTRIRLIENKKNVGLVRNLHQAIYAGKGDLICWLNQDDIFYADKLERQYLAMQTHGTIGACFSAKDDIDAKGNLLNRFNPTQMIVDEADHLVQLFGGCYLSAPTVMMQREAYERLGGFDPSYTIAFDYDMWFRLKRCYEVKIIQAPLLGFRHHDSNLSSEKNEGVIAAECADIVRKNLQRFDIKEIYPFLNGIDTGEQERIETSACLLSLAELIWRQKKWHKLLVCEIFQLIEKALQLNPVLMDAYVLGLELQNDRADTPLYRYLAQRKADTYKAYTNLLAQLQSAFLTANQSRVAEITHQLYAMSPLDGDPYFRLAFQFYRIGDHPAASTYCANAIKLNPRHEQARQLWHLLKTGKTPQIDQAGC